MEQAKTRVMFVSTYDKREQKNSLWMVLLNIMRITNYASSS